MTTQPTTQRERDHLRNVRYGEVLLVTRQGLHAEAAVYNTLGLNDCPEDAWRALDAEAIKREHKALAVLLNGPRYFMMDRNSIEITQSRVDNIVTFGTLQMRELATVRIPLKNLLGGAKHIPYTGSTVSRTTAYTYEAGKKVYELVDANGTVYILQSYALIIDPSLNEAALDTLGDRLHLPAGWRYQVRVLESNEVVTAEKEATVIQDDFQNSYQRVDHRA